MTGEKAKEEKYDESSSITGESILANINHDQTQKKDYDDTTTVGNTKLKDITKEQTEAKEYDDSSNVQKKEIENINKDQTEKKDYDESSSISGQSILGSINTDNMTAKSEIDDDAIVAGVENAEYFRDEKLKEDGLIEEEPKKVE